MNNWRSINDIVTYSGKGVTPKYVTKSSIVVLNQKCIRNNKIDYSFARYIDDSKQYSEDKYLRVGDVLVNSTGQGTAGRVAMVDFIPEGKNVIVDSHILVLRTKNFWESKCLNYSLFSIEKILQTYIDGSTGQGEFDKIRLFNIQVNYSQDKLEQKNIVTVLSALDDKIEINNRINTELEQMAKTLYDYWFVQFDFSDANGKPYKSSGGKMVYNEVLKREIPEGWEVKKLDNYVNFIRGISYTSKSIDDSYGIPMINLKSFNLDGTYREDGLKYYKGKYNQEKLLLKNDLLIAITDVTREAEIIGKAILVPELGDNILCSCDVAKVIPENQKLNKSYLRFLFNSDYYHSYIKYFASGTLVLHLDLNGISWFTDVIPPIKLQNKFGELAETIESKVQDNTKQNQELAALRDWLLPMLMNGQATVGAAAEYSTANEESAQAAEDSTQYKKPKQAKK